MATASPKKLVDGVLLPNAAAATPGLYVAPANTRSIPKKAVFTNTDTVARLVTAHLVPSGGSASAANMVTKAYPIGPGMTYEAFEIENQVLMSGGFITAFSDAASVVSCHISGLEVQVQ